LTVAKARQARLKVFRTPIGFHDAYVAAPSQKAALEAWATGTNLFAAGAAELVTDPKLTKEALARPGEVIRVVRGTADEHVRALGKAKTKGGSRTKSGMTKEASERAAGKARGPRPSPAAVERAEKALERAEGRQRAELDKLRAEQQAIERRRREIEREHRGERDKLRRAVDEARESYQAAMEDWAG
jgi:hypothetical protein